VATKISIIGAGSGAFSLAMIRDICVTPNLAGSTVTFMDINPDRLDASYALCQRFAQELGADLRLEKTFDRRTALQGAEFVINTALAAGHHRLREGWEIAQKHGASWGASFHIMYDEAFWINYYQFRLFDALVEDMLDICPQAWLLLVANPVLAGITHLARRYPQARVVGLCHGFSAIYHLAEVLGLDRVGLTFEIPGVNHFVWATEVYHRGRSVFGLLDRYIDEQARLPQPVGRVGALPIKAVDLYKRFRAYPIGDTANWTGACWPVWYHSDPETERKWGEDPWAGWQSYFSHVEAAARDIQCWAMDPYIPIVDHVPAQASGEVMIPIIESIHCDIPRVIIGNLRNSGSFVPGIPSDFEVEIPMLVSKRGIQGIQTKGLPPALTAHTLRDRVAPVNLELAAYDVGSRELLLQLVMMDPWFHSEARARAMLEEILALPYHAEMREHYR
jgi:alpha-galactosidase